MEIPNKLKADGKTVEICRVTSAQGHDDAGSYVTFYDQINIMDKSEGLAEEDEAETFMHEIFERTNSIYDLKLRHSVICTLSNCLFAMIRDNNLDFRRPK